jgi:hypothetical protein
VPPPDPSSGLSGASRPSGLPGASGVSTVVPGVVPAVAPAVPAVAPSAGPGPAPAAARSAPPPTMRRLCRSASPPGTAGAPAGSLERPLRCFSPVGPSGCFWRLDGRSRRRAGGGTRRAGGRALRGPGARSGRCALRSAADDASALSLREPAGHGGCPLRIPRAASPVLLARRAFRVLPASRRSFPASCRRWHPPCRRSRPPRARGPLRPLRAPLRRRRCVGSLAPRARRARRMHRRIPRAASPVLLAPRAFRVLPASRRSFPPSCRRWQPPCRRPRPARALGPLRPLRAPLRRRRCVGSLAPRARRARRVPPPDLSSGFSDAPRPSRLVGAVRVSIGVRAVVPPRGLPVPGNPGFFRS